MLQQTIDWLDERVDLSEIRHFIAEKGVPVHAQKIWYYLGGLTLFLLGIQLSTGILLLLYYRPSASVLSTRSRAVVMTSTFPWNERAAEIMLVSSSTGLTFEP